jgi:hypothetical protein
VTELKEITNFSTNYRILTLETISEAIGSSLHRLIHRTSSNRSL